MQTVISRADLLYFDTLRLRPLLSELRHEAAVLADDSSVEVFEIGWSFSLVATCSVERRTATPTLEGIGRAVAAEGRWPEKGPLLAGAVEVARVTSPDAAGRVLAEDIATLMPSRLVVPAWLVREHRAGVLWVLDSLLEALRKVVLAVRIAARLIARTKPLVLLIVAVCLHYGHRGETGDGSRSGLSDICPGCFARC